MSGLYSLALYVGDYLHRWQYPTIVEYNEDRVVDRERYSDRVVFSFDRSRGDTPEPVTGAHRGRRQAQLSEGCLCEIYAKSPVEGAMIADHELACRLYRNAVIMAIMTWTKQGYPTLALSSGRFATKAERSSVEVWPGAVYELRFVMPHVVEERHYPGEWRDTYTLQEGDFAPTIIEPTRQGT